MPVQRLHPHLQLTRTLTGRLATSGFPVLGLPKKSEEGKQIRSLVRAPKGFVIGSWDYSQIELRIAAHLSEDIGMMHAFRDGIDIHALTVERVFGLPPDEAKQKGPKRTGAKAANFGYWMGLSPKGLTEQVHKEGVLEWSADCPGCKSFKAPHDRDCDSVHFFQTFDREFPGAPAYQKARMQHAEKTGFAYGMWGMQWYLPGVWSPHEEVAEQTKRQAFALPIQEGAQRLIKQAMRVVYEQDLPWARKQQATVEPILQIHDELLFVVEKDFARAWHRRVKRTMETVAKLKVPIVAEGSWGPSWLEQEEAA